jgi:hypothetical protein
VEGDCPSELHARENDGIELHYGSIILLHAVRAHHRNRVMHPHPAQQDDWEATLVEWATRSGPRDQLCESTV